MSYFDELPNDCPIAAKERDIDLIEARTESGRWTQLCCPFVNRICPATEPGDSRCLAQVDYIEPGNCTQEHCKALFFWCRRMSE